MNWKVQALFLKSFESIPGRTADNSGIMCLLPSLILNKLRIQTAMEAIVDVNLERRNFFILVQDKSAVSSKVYRETFGSDETISQAKKYQRNQKLAAPHMVQFFAYRKSG